MWSSLSVFSSSEGIRPSPSVGRPVAQSVCVCEELVKKRKEEVKFLTDNVAAKGSQRSQSASIGGRLNQHGISLLNHVIKGPGEEILAAIAGNDRVLVHPKRGVVDRGLQLRDPCVEGRKTGLQLRREGRKREIFE